MNYEKLAVSIIKDLRGSSSQLNFSHQLGYEYNIVHRWETTKKNLLWKDFLHICHLKNIPIDRLLCALVGREVPLHSETDLFHFLSKDRSISSTSTTLKISINILYNYANGKSKIKLSHLLQMIDYFLTFSIEDFLEQVCTPHLMEEYFPNYKLKKTFNKISIREPKLALLLSLLNLNMYKNLETNDHCFLARKLNISVAKVEEYLTILKDNKLIAFVDGKYVILETGGVVSINNYTEEELFSIDKFWIMESLDYHARKLNEERHFARKGYLRLTFDEKSLEEFDHLTLDYFKKAQEIACKSDSPETIRVINLNYFDPLRD